MWRPTKKLVINGESLPLRGSFLYPGYPTREDTEAIIDNPCLAAARRLTLDAGNTAAQVASAYIQGCASQSVPVRSVAATEAATLLGRVNDYEGALAALDSSGITPDLPIRSGIQEGIVPFRLVTHRTHRAQLLLELGRDTEALGLLYDTGLEVTALDAPDASSVLGYVSWPIIPELRDRGRIREAQRLERRRAQAERRVQAWREIADRILDRPASGGDEPPRFIYDQYAETPFLLYYGPIRDAEFGAGLALDQPTLLQDFLAGMRRYRPFLTITNAEGGWVAGARGGGAVAVDIPFSRTLSHLRVGVRGAAFDRQMGRLQAQWLLPLMGVIGFLLLGMGALWAQLKASLDQEKMLNRQREFTQRVTHELKTPLAGIRVMAENLESGAFRGEEQLKEMAQRIVDEADRLAARVDEVLAVSRERTVPDPQPFDPEEVSLELIDAWGPRMEHAGIRLHADLHATDEVRGDYNSVRDAVACLLDNAIKYADENRAERQVWLTLKQEGRWILFDVADNGMGVPRSMRREIFEQFVRVEGPNRGKAGGHGLGLSQVESIATAHGGRVVCSEGVDGGARFVLRLPADR